jgi:uncharacterized membrane protein (Fun14 family)
LLSFQVQVAYDTGIPSQLSYGFVCGYCSGYALKAVGKGAAVVFGSSKAISFSISSIKILKTH